MTTTGMTTPSGQPLSMLWFRAGAAFDAKDYAGAARLLEELATETPGRTDVRMLLARSYYHSAQLRRAEQELREIIERDPVEPYAHLMLGRTLQRQGREAEATRYLNLAAAFNGEAATAP